MDETFESIAEIHARGETIFAVDDALEIFLTTVHMKMEKTPHDQIETRADTSHYEPPYRTSA